MTKCCPGCCSAPWSASDPSVPTTSLIFPSFCIIRILFIDTAHHAPTAQDKEPVMITSLQALLDISLAIASAALTVAVFATLVQLAGVVRQRATVLLQRSHDSARMQ
jgi:hypothetical protein